MAGQLCRKRGGERTYGDAFFGWSLKERRPRGNWGSAGTKVRLRRTRGGNDTHEVLGDRLWASSDFDPVLELERRATVSVSLRSVLRISGMHRLTRRLTIGALCRSLPSAWFMPSSLSSSAMTVDRYPSTMASHVDTCRPAWMRSG